MKATTTSKDLIPSFIKVPEHLEPVKAMLKPEVLTFCAQNPRNGYPVHTPVNHFHIVSESGLTEEVLADIYAADKKRIYSGVEHMFAVLPDDEYDKLHRQAVKRKTPIITSVFIMDTSAKELASLDSSTLLETLLEPFVNPNNGIEVMHFVPRSIWDDEAEAILKREDRQRGTTGVISHYINIVEDDDLNTIFDPILESLYQEV